MSYDPRPTNAEFRTMPHAHRRALSTPTLNGEPLSPELVEAFRARRAASRKPGGVNSQGEVANGLRIAIQSASVSTDTGED